MVRERALKVVLVVVGLFFSAAIYPAIGGLLDPVHSDTGDTMMMGLYVALGIFLLIAVRNPAAHRSLMPSQHGRASLTQWSCPCWDLKSRANGQDFWPALAC